MSPIEITFLLLMVIFGVIGMARGYHLGLGITTMLFAALSLIFLGEYKLGPQLDALFSAVAGPGNADVVQAIVYTLFLIFIVFISVQGEILVFPGGGNSPVLGFLVGLVNAYLCIGSIFYYWSVAGWPLPWVVHTYDQLYMALVRIMPPAILPWWFCVVMLVIMLVMRVIG
jgi:hypothetical protein